MAGVRWQGRGPDGFKDHIRTKHAELFDVAEDIIRVTIIEAAENQEQLLEEAETRTGLARVASGRGAHTGRHVTGNMIERISIGIDRTRTTIVGWWGWDDVEGYIGEQENGLAGTNIPPAHSIFNSFIIARTKFRQRARAAGKRK